YRRKGGQFRKPEDLSKIYGLESSTFRALLPYIRIEPEAAAEGKQARPSDPKAGDRPGSISESGGTAPEKVASATAIQTKRPDALQTNAGTEASGLLAGNFELNSADTSTLQLLKGVGAVTAARIVRYGSQLGGYYTVSQLAEIKGIYPAALASLQRSLSVNPALIRKININKVSLERLRAHPYIDFYQAKVIIGLRTARKGIKALSELAAFKEFSAEDIDRLKWYVEL
ncbi:MAG: helix-hairpin-helix domain-containing protein, partial [Bacteroidota bacterium]|nr:helix-hairpin-helix domain-containing protein [Bacteroidota bacterium]